MKIGQYSDHQLETNMQTHLGDRVNHEELTALINGEKFQHFGADTQTMLLGLHDVLDSEMQAISRQVDALDKQVADLFVSLDL